MSHFSATLTRLLSGRTQSEVASAAGIPRGSLSQYATDTRGITVGALTELLKAFPDTLDQFDLIRAHLRDEIPATHYEQIDIVLKSHISDGTLRETGKPLSLDEIKKQMSDGDTTPAWRKNLEASIATIRVAAEKDEDARNLITDLAKVLS